MPSSHSRIRAARHERQIARLKDTIGEKLGCSRFNYNDKSKNITQDLVKRSLSNIKNQYLALKIKTFKALQNTDLLQKNLMIIDDKKQVRQLAKVLIASSLNIFEIIFKSWCRDVVGFNIVRLAHVKYKTTKNELTKLSKIINWENIVLTFLILLSSATTSTDVVKLLFQVYHESLNSMIFKQYNATIIFQKHLNNEPKDEKSINIQSLKLDWLLKVLNKNDAPLRRATWGTQLADEMDSSLIRDGKHGCT